MPKVSIKQLLEVYAECSSYQQTANYFGMGHSTVHSRITHYLDRVIGCPWQDIVIQNAVKDVLKDMEGDNGEL